MNRTRPPMARIPAHPLAEHPLERLAGKPKCSLPQHDRAYLVTVMLENSLRRCGPYVKGLTLDVGCGRGIQAQILARRGPSVFGIDPGEKQIRNACHEVKRSNVRERVNFLCGMCFNVSHSPCRICGR